MPDDLNPSHSEPAEGPRDAAFSSDAGAETTGEPGGPAANSAAKANEMLEQLRDAVEDLAEKAAPAVREFSAKAAELVAVAADKAAPLVQRAGEVTADASGKLAEKSRTWAADLRETIGGSPVDHAKPAVDDAGDAATDAASDVAEGDPPR
jgi:hypothetical protein